MSRKRKKKNRGNNVMTLPVQKPQTTNKGQGYTTVGYSKFEDCHKAKFVAVGDKKVFCCGYNDLNPASMRIIRNLDLFVGMTSSFSSFEKPSASTNKFVAQFMRMLEPETLPNLIVVDVRDFGIDKHLAKCVINAFRDGWNIGFGCLAGHGRTGWLLGRLLMEFENLQGDALKKEIRARLCYKAIEGNDQFKDLGLEPEPYTPTWSSNWKTGTSYKSICESLAEKEDREKSRAFDEKNIDSTKYKVETCVMCKGSGFDAGYSCTWCDGSGITLTKKLVENGKDLPIMNELKGSK